MPKFTPEVRKVIDEIHRSKQVISIDEDLDALTAADGELSVIDFSAILPAKNPLHDVCDKCREAYLKLESKEHASHILVYIFSSEEFPLLMQDIQVLKENYIDYLPEDVQIIWGIGAWDQSVIRVVSLINFTNN